MPTKREIEFNFMGLKLTDVAEWDLRFLSRLLATLNQKDTLERLPGEEWIFSCSDSRCLERRLPLVEGDDRSTQSRA